MLSQAQGLKISLRMSPNQSNGDANRSCGTVMESAGQVGEISPSGFPLSASAHGQVAQQDAYGRCACPVKRRRRVPSLAGDVAKGIEAH